MTYPILACPSCKNLLPRKEEVHICKAFPNGIPEDYLWGDIDVKKLNECHNGYKFEDALAD